MDPYYSKVNLKFALFSIIMAFHFTTRSVQAGLPNENVMKATSCLREFLEEKILTETFKMNGETLTDGEYLKVYCDEVDDEDFHDLFKNKAAEDYDGTSIKKCLAKTKSENLFQEYVDSVASNQNDDQESQQESETVHTTSGQNLKLSETPVMKFYRGVCTANFKPINFNSLKDEKEKAVTVQCLAKCANKFLSRVQYALNGVRDEALKLPFNKLSENDIEKLKNTPHPSRKFTTEKFYAALKKANEPLSIDPISQIGKGYLIYNNEIYYNLDRHIDDSVRNVTKLIHIDNILSSMRELYQNCAKLECAMDRKSTPLLSLIKSATENSYSTILKKFENDTEDVKNWVDLHTGDWRKFCEALMGKVTIALPERHFTFEIKH